MTNLNSRGHDPSASDDGRSISDPPTPPDIAWILEQCAVSLFIEVQAWDILRGETRLACAYFLE